MQINGIRSNYVNRPVFTARVPKDIQNSVLREAVELGTEGLNRAKAQIAKVQSWGRPDSNLEMALDPSNGRLLLGMSNYSISKNYGAGLGKDCDNFVDAFMDLSEKDILKAEKKIAEEVENSKSDLIAKACADKKLSQKITGMKNPSEEDLGAAIDKLSEDEIINLRFNLDEKSRFFDDNILDFEF